MKKNEILGIQYARGCAAIFIVIYHSMRKGMLLNLNEFEFSIGAMSVPFFFIVSGFIMAYIQSNREGGFIEFIKNRIIRIIPLYYLFTTIILFIYLIKPHLVYYSHHPTISIFGSYTLYPVHDTSMLLNPGWTLRPELTFYLIFGLSLTFFKKYTHALDFVILSSITLSTSTLFFSNEIFSAYADYLYIFAFGVLIYRLSSRFNILSFFSKKIFIFIFFGLLCFVLSINQEANVLSVTIMSLFFISIVANEKNINHNNVIAKFFYLLGGASYSIYLTHVFSIGLISFLFTRYHFSSISFNLLSISLSIFVGVLSYRMVEIPLISTIRKINKKNPKTTKR